MTFSASNIFAVTTRVFSPFISLAVVLLAAVTLSACADFAGPALSVNGTEFTRAEMDDYLTETASTQSGQTVEELGSFLPLNDVGGSVNTLIYTAVLDDLMVENNIVVTEADIERQREALRAQGLNVDLLPQAQLELSAKAQILETQLVAQGQDFQVIIDALVAADVSIDPRYGLEWDTSLEVPGLALANLNS